MAIEIRETIIIEDGRIHEIWSRYFSLIAEDSGSWCEMFKTRGYRRRQEAADRISYYGHRIIKRMIEREGLEWESWKVLRRGRNDLTSVQTRSDQYYEIVRIK